MSNNYTKEENKNINDKPINSQNILLKYNKNVYNSKKLLTLLYISHLILLGVILWTEVIIKHQYL